MTSFIVIATDKTKRDIYLKDFCDKHNIDIFDQTTLTLETSVKQNTQSIGIEDIKYMQKKIFLKPIKSEKKAIIIDGAELLTIEAQNALLKILEEPPAHTLIVLSTSTKETLLPTIISRCQIIQLEEAAPQLSEKEKIEMETFIHDLSAWGVGEKLKKAESLAKDKDKAIEWTGKLILVLRENLIENVISTNAERRDPPEISHSVRNDKDYLNVLKEFQTLHTLLKTTNVNPRFAIENTLLSIAS
jgi:DNA polymerase III delta prime subunit